MELERHNYDVVVVGAGGAGLRAAIEAHESGARTAVVCKSLLGNVVMLWAYTASCHSCRHIVGGRLNHFSRHPLRYRLWTQVSRLNGMHARFAWLSLFSVAIADAYVFLLATDTITDLRFF